MISTLLETDNRNCLFMTKFETNSYTGTVTVSVFLSTSKGKFGNLIVKPPDYYLYSGTDCSVEDE